MYNDVLFEVADGIGKVTLNRPQQMNALTLDMILALHEKLAEWAADKSIRTVMLYGAGDKAFCAGGDIRALYDAKTNGDTRVLHDFFWHEYRLNYRIATYPKPVIAVMNGMTMGGGAGLAMNSVIRVATENAVFAMPECGIGLFPDVGGGHFLNKCPGEVGMFLALTGLRLRAAGLIYTGLATHSIEASSVASLTPDNLETLQMRTRVADIGKMRPAIDTCFSLDTLDEIVTALSTRNDPGAQDSLNLLKRCSPLSLKITFAHMRRSRGRKLDEVLKEEWILSQNFMAGREFQEGVRAILIERDGEPKWQHRKLSDVSAGEVDTYFKKPSGVQELDLKL